jgi:hypothetical protein
VLLWFDTEDYLTPAADDAALRLAELLTARGVRATFKLVGEKARVLERRGRKDVIEALSRHAIGYHTDFHSVHPVVTEYLAESGFLDGMEEFVRREGPGAADVRRIFGLDTLACYGQPGSSWAPQAVAALVRIGVAPAEVPCYVDEGDHVGLGDAPFWYAGALNVYRLRTHCTRLELHDSAALDPACQAVTALTQRVVRQEGGGLISIYFHPCEWVHREFWDGVNFRRGSNPPRTQWKPAPLRSTAETEGAFSRFESYIDHIRDLPNIRFVTAGELPRLYPDRVRTEGVTAAELAQIARRTVAGSGRGLDFQTAGDKAFSLADQFEALTLALARLVEGKTPDYPLAVAGLFGPDNPPPAARLTGPVDAEALRSVVRDTRDFIRIRHRVPARVFVGSAAAAPADFLCVMAQAYLALDPATRESARPPLAGLTLPASPTAVLPEQQVAPDSPGLFGGWVIHREGFRAPRILEVARLQAWTLKPALRAAPPRGQGTPGT